MAMIFDACSNPTIAAGGGRAAIDGGGKRRAAEVA
jgi:hypothetical protein